MGNDQTVNQIKPKISFDIDEYQARFVSKPIQFQKITNDNVSQNTQTGVRSNSTRAKEEEDDFNLSFDEDFFLDL